MVQELVLLVQKLKIGPTGTRSYRFRSFAQRPTARDCRSFPGRTVSVTLFSRVRFHGFHEKPLHGTVSMDSLVPGARC